VRIHAVLEQCLDDLDGAPAARLVEGRLVLPRLRAWIRTALHHHVHQTQLLLNIVKVETGSLATVTKQKKTQKERSNILRT
jgi:hypothetical protein